MGADQRRRGHVRRSVDPRVEELVCARLGLRPAEASTQVIQRDRHAEFVWRWPSPRPPWIGSPPRSGIWREPRSARCRSRSRRDRRARAPCHTSGTRSCRERVSRAGAGDPWPRPGRARGRAAVARARHLALVGRARDPAGRDGLLHFMLNDMAWVMDGLPCSRRADARQHGRPPGASSSARACCRRSSITAWRATTRTPRPARREGHLGPRPPLPEDGRGRRSATPASLSRDGVRCALPGRAVPGEPRRGVRATGEAPGGGGVSADAVLHARGKVRDVYEVGDRLLIVATDRISAFDVGPARRRSPTRAASSPASRSSGSTGRPTWLGTTWSAPNHRDPPSGFDDDDSPGRAMLVQRADVVPVECVARGYLSGSGWKQYRDRRIGVRRGAPAGSGGIRPPARADLHADDEGRRPATTCRSRWRRRATWWGRGSPSG